MLFMFMHTQAPAQELDIEALIEAHAGAVKRCAFLCLRDERLAEDMCQEAFLRLWQNPPGEREPGRLRAWLLRVTINLCRDYLRTPWRRRVSPAQCDDLLAAPDGKPLPEDEALQLERDEALYRAVMALPLKYREPIILHYYFDYTQQETARMLSIGDSALRSRLKRARDRLRRALGEEVNA